MKVATAGSSLALNPHADSDPVVSMCAPVVGPDEEQLVLEVLRSGNLVAGQKVEQFEAACAAMAETTHAVAVSNGTVSLELILEALGIGPGDEVITTAFTFAATVSAILRSGATARLVDIGPDFTVDVHAVEAAIGPRTAAIIPVHLFGQPADVAELTALCAKHGLALVEDSAQAHGACVRGRPVGGWGHGSFSFYATKNVSCGEGGVVTTNDDQLSRTMRLLRNQGMEHRHHHEIMGHNLRMSEMHAALGLPSMARLAEINERRRSNAKNLTRGLAEIDGLVLPREVPGKDHVWHQYTILTDDRDALASDLGSHGVQSAVHYPKLVHEHPAYRDRSDVIVEDCRRARSVSRRCLSLPVHDRLSAEQLDHVVNVMRLVVGHQR